MLQIPEFSIKRRRFRYSQKGLSIRPEYRSWYMMLRRCYCKTDKSYRTHGARGITVCLRWRKSFLSFFGDMGPRNGLQLDRIDNNGNYGPLNCRWVTSKQNNSNRRDSRLITFHNKTQTMSQWASDIGIDRAVMHYRLKHWPLKEALTTPPRPWSPNRPISRK